MEECNNYGMYARNFRVPLKMTRTSSQLFGAGAAGSN